MILKGVVDRVGNSF